MDHIDQTGQPSPRPDFQQSIDTQHFVERLKAASPGDLLSYDELSSLVGRNVRNGAYGSLYSARKFVEKEHDIVFAAVTNEGIKRLTDDEIVDTGKAALKRIGRHAKRAARRLTCVDYENLTAERKTDQQTGLSILGALREVSKPAYVKKVQGRVERAQAALPLARVLEALSE